ncbi:response regulator [Parageobacillus thermoglucosidasius]|uniref:response regulator n=1 Tax=Parageobacillus thermoglucosidasius TaxID=1426 RepID=UPI000E15621C|nr:response regulator [Parageobacillus thermoglucosidasius]RDE27410.1 response regulator [Parageobacillus thermoglucosidasius]
MYKVLLVDDDRIIRKSLATTVPWEKNGYELVGEASNGEEGLLLIDKYKPQVVISDIKMPFMDGLQMAQISKNRYPETKVILLTGYEDFKFAQEAIKVKAFDYLLKPIESSILLEKVKQATIEWENEQISQEQKTKGIRFLKQKWLKKLLHHQGDKLEICSEMEKLGINLSDEYIVVCIIRLEDCIQRDIKEEELDNIYKICEGIMKSQGDVFDWDENEFILILQNQAREIVTQGIEKLVEQVCFYIKQELGITVTAAIGQIYKGLTSIALSYFEARTTLEFRSITPQNRILYKPKNFSPLIDAQLNKIEDELLLKVKLGLVQETLLIWNKFKSYLLEQPYISLHDIRLIAIKMVILLLREARKWSEKWEKCYRKDLVIYYYEIITLQNVHDILDKVAQVAHSLASYMEEKNNKEHESVVDKAIKYIEQYYSKEGLSLNEVAQAIHVNPAYLSNMFKVKKGINFSDYLLELRMKKAMELLRKKDTKVYEVAEMVGYSNPQYFSVCFKKYTGVSPLDFKKLE